MKKGDKSLDDGADEEGDGRGVDDGNKWWDDGRDEDGGGNRDGSVSEAEKGSEDEGWWAAHRRQSITLYPARARGI